MRREVDSDEDIARSAEEAAIDSSPSIARSGLITASVMGLLSIGYLWQTSQITVLANGTASIDARAYPYLLGTTLLVLSCALALSSAGHLRRTATSHAPGKDDAVAEPTGRHETAPTAQPPSMMRTFAAAVSAVLYLIVLPPAGFLLATPLLVAALIVIADTRSRYLGTRIWVPLAVGAVMAVAAHVLFAGLLGVLLPAGVFDPGWGF